jgi:hypothetical protein
MNEKRYAVVEGMDGEYIAEVCGKRGKMVMVPRCQATGHAARMDARHWDEMARTPEEALKKHTDKLFRNFTGAEMAVVRRREEYRKAMWLKLEDLKVLVAR